MIFALCVLFYAFPNHKHAWVGLLHFDRCIFPPILFFTCFPTQRWSDLLCHIGNTLWGHVVTHDLASIWGLWSLFRMVVTRTRKFVSDRLASIAKFCNFPLVWHAPFLCSWRLSIGPIVHRSRWSPFRFEMIRVHVSLILSFHSIQKDVGVENICDSMRGACAELCRSWSWRRSSRVWSTMVFDGKRAARVWCFHSRHVLVVNCRCHDA